MKRAYVLVEGDTDAAFLQRILPSEVTKDVELIAAGGNGSIRSLARSLLARRRTPVVVFIDAASLVPSVIEERQDDLEELIRMAAGSVPVKVVVVVPEVEVVFFAAPEVIERVLGVKVQEPLLSFGLRDPSGILAYLSKQSGREWDTSQAIKLLDQHDIERIRATPAVSELTSFLQKVQGDDNAA